MATFNRDFRDFFALLNSREVDYMIIGGVAYNFHAVPRSTKDIDIWVNPERENLQRLLNAIQAFGFPTEATSLEELATMPKVLMLGRVPYRIDVLTRPDGIEWSTAHKRVVPSKYDDVPISVLGIEDLICNKRAAGRPRDLADVAMLEDILIRQDKNKS